jgi:hypothetical protein
MEKFTRGRNGTDFMLNHCTHAALLRDSQRLPLSVVCGAGKGGGAGGVKAARAGKENCDPVRRPGWLEEQVGPRTDFEQRRDAARLLLLLLQRFFDGELEREREQNRFLGCRAHPWL